VGHGWSPRQRYTACHLPLSSRCTCAALAARWRLDLSVNPRWIWNRRGAMLWHGRPFDLSYKDGGLNVAGRKLTRYFAPAAVSYRG